MKMIKKKWLLRSLIGLGIFVVAVSIFIFFFLDNIVISKLESKLENSYGKTYSIEYKSINYSVLFTSVSIELKEVEFKTDAEKAKKHKSPIINLESESISIEGVSLWSFFLYSELNMNNIFIESPHLSIARNKEFKNEEESNPEDEELDISKHINNLMFDEFEITNGSAEFFNDINMKDTLFHLKKFDFKANNFKSSNENLSELLIIKKYKRLNVKSESFNLNLGEDNYSIYVEKFKGELIKGDLELENIHFKPPYQSIQSGKEYRSDVKISKLKLIGVDYESGDNRSLAADSAIIKDTDIDLTKNQALSNKREKTLWMENLLSLKEQLSIEHLKFQNCSLSSEIQKLGGDNTYTLKLSNLEGEIENINTDSKSDYLTIRASSNVFKTGKLKMTVDLPYNSPQTSTFKGTISNIDLKSFNGLMIKMYSLKIEEGKLNDLSFEGKTNGDKSEGSLTFIYDDLKGSFIKESNGKKKPAKLISKLMNMVIYESNPREGEDKPEEVDFSFTKEKYQGQVMLWLGGIVDGTVITIIGKKKHDFLLNQIEE
ncbi:MAG: DUF748 domain-containing protein [Brumimicrobium sp.]